MSTTARSPTDTSSLSSVATIIAVVISVAGLVCCIATVVIVVCLIKKMNRPRGLIHGGQQQYPSYPPYASYYSEPYGNPYGPPAPPAPISQNLPPPYPGTPGPTSELTKVSN